MKIINFAGSFLLAAALLGCSKDEGPTQPVGRVFSGITERDEWGDTLSVDTTDWVIVSGPPIESASCLQLPYFRDGVYLGEQVISNPADQPEFSIGAYPNPFIGGPGRLLIDLFLPVVSDVEIRAEDESGQINVPVFPLPAAPAGFYTISWLAQDSTGQVLPDGIYRIFFESGQVSSFGDVELTLTQQPDPPGTEPYVVFAQGHYDESEYTAYEFWVATTYGPTGQSGGPDRFTLPIESWELKSYPERFGYLPPFMNYDLSSASLYQYHYLLAYKHFQFGAGWADSLDIGITDSTDASWQKENVDHNTFVDLFEGGQ